MKIGFVLDDSLDSTDGVQQYILTLGEWFTNQGQDVHYLVGQTKREDIKNVHSLSRNTAVRFNGNRMTIPLPASRRYIQDLLNTERFNVLHVQMPYSPFLAGRVIRQASPDTKLVGTFHILPFGSLQNFGAHLLSWRLRRITQKINPIWSVSKAAQDFAHELGMKSEILPNVVNVEHFAKGKPLAQYKDNFTVVFLGRLVERKGCFELLHAIKQLQDESPISNLKVVIIGDGPQREKLEHWVESHGLDTIVEFTGHIDEADKPNYLASADIAVFPSLGGESFGIVLIEAMAAGAGVVLGGNNAGYHSVLKDIPKSLFDPTNPTQLATKLKDFYMDKKLRNELHKVQQTLVRQYDVAVVGKKLLSYYREEA